MQKSSKGVFGAALVIGTVSRYLAVLAVVALGSSMHAAVLNSAYWAESSTTAGGAYNTMAPSSASQNGNSIVAFIPTDGNQSSPNNDVVNYFRTFSALPGASAAYDGYLLGDLAGNTGLTATFSLNNSAYAPGEQFRGTDLVGETYVGQQGYNEGLRLMFMGSYLSDGITPNEWWSNQTAAFVTSMNNGQDVTLTVAFDPSQWSNYNGQIGNGSPDDTAQFYAALSGVTRLGLSFGSGYFFSDGFSFSNNAATASLQVESVELTPEPATLLVGALGLMAAMRGRRRS